MTAHRILNPVLLLLTPIALSACGESQGDALTEACVAAATSQNANTPEVKSGCACVTETLVGRIGDKNLSWFIDYHKMLVTTGMPAPLTTDVEVNNYLMLAEANAFCKTDAPAEPAIGAPD